jgi:hypothetical protein
MSVLMRVDANDVIDLFCQHRLLLSDVGPIVAGPRRQDTAWQDCEELRHQADRLLITPSR